MNRTFVSLRCAARGARRVTRRTDVLLVAAGTIGYVTRYTGCSLGVGLLAFCACIAGYRAATCCTLLAAGYAPDCGVSAGQTLLVAVRDVLGKVRSLALFSSDTRPRWIVTVILLEVRLSATRLTLSALISPRVALGTVISILALCACCSITIDEVPVCTDCALGFLIAITRATRCRSGALCAVSDPYIAVYSRGLVARNAGLMGGSKRCHWVLEVTSLTLVTYSCSTACSLTDSASRRGCLCIAPALVQEVTGLSALSTCGRVFV